MKHIFSFAAFRFRAAIRAVSAVFCLSLPLVGQSKTVAVFEPSVAGGSIDLAQAATICNIAEAVINQQMGYTVVTRRQISARTSEMRYQQLSGDVKKIAQEGKALGAALVCQPMVTVDRGYIHLYYNLISTKTGAIHKNSEPGSISAESSNYAFQDFCRGRIAAVFAAIRGTSGWHIGFQASGVVPMSNFAEVAGTGFGATVFAEYVLPGDKGWALRARGEYMVFGEMEGTGRYDGDGQFAQFTTTRFNAKVTQLGAMGDLLYYNSSGFYAFAGTGVLSRKNNGTISYLRPGTSEQVEFDGWDTVADGVGTETAGGFAVSVGGGWYPFNKNFGVEVKYTTTDSSWVQASLCLRF